MPDGEHSVVGDWPPARMVPESYPGTCPSGHYLLCNGFVYPLAEAATASGYEVVHESGDRDDLDSYLARLGARPLAERYPVLAYGANRNPGTLDIKFHHYGSSSLFSNYCVPVLRATISGADVVACRLHGHGYFYGELLVNSPFSDLTELEVRVGLVDAAQLRALNDSEGLPEHVYSAACVPGVRVAGLRQEISPITYVTNSRVWASPEFNAPIGFSVIPAAGRRYPAMTSREIMDHVLDAYGLRSAVSRITGLADDGGLAHELAKYLNGQWWYHFNSGDGAIPGYAEILKLFNSAMDTSVIDTHTRDQLADLGLLLDTDSAYQPPSSLQLGNMISQPS